MVVYKISNSLFLINEFIIDGRLALPVIGLATSGLNSRPDYNYCLPSGPAGFWTVLTSDLYLPSLCKKETMSAQSPCMGELFIPKTQPLVYSCQ